VNHLLAHSLSVRVLEFAAALTVLEFSHVLPTLLLEFARIADPERECKFLGNFVWGIWRGWFFVVF
jgi:hypothetical protein